MSYEQEAVRIRNAAGHAYGLQDASLADQRPFIDAVLLVADRLHALVQATANLEEQVGIVGDKVEAAGARISP